MNSRFFYFTFVGVIAIAFVLYLGATTYGLPHALFGDELVSVAAGFSLLAQKTLRANFDFYYLPPLLSYLLAPIYAIIGVVGIVSGFFGSIADYQNFVLLNRELFLIVGRIISALFGIGGVYLLFAFARRVFSPIVALLSAIFLAFDFLYLHEAQVGRFWAPATFFIIAAIYSFQRLMETREKKWYFLSALALGLGFGVGYIPLLLVIWFFILQWFLCRKETKNIWQIYTQGEFLQAGAFLLGLVALFSWLNIHAFTRQFGRSIATIADFFGLSVSFAISGLSVESQFFPNILKSLLFLWYDNPFLLVTSICALIFFALSPQKKFWKILFIGFPIVYLLTISATFAELENRYVLPIIPFFALSSSYFLASLWTSQSSSIVKKTVVAFLSLCIAAYGLYAGLKYTYLLQKNDTRNDVVEWIYNNAPRDSAIILDVPFLTLNGNKDSILYLKEKNPFWLNTRDEYLLTLSDADFPADSYFILNLSYIQSETIDFSKFQSGYYIFEFWGPEDRLARRLTFLPSARLEASFYPSKTIVAIHNLLQDPSKPIMLLDKIQRLGPYIEVYKFEK